MSQIGDISGKRVQFESPADTGSAEQVQSTQSSGVEGVKHQDLYESSQVTGNQAALLAQAVSAPDVPLNQDAIAGANSFAHQFRELGSFGGGDLAITGQFLKLQMLAGEVDSDMANNLSRFQSGILQTMHRQRIDLGNALHSQGPGLQQQEQQYTQLAEQEGAKAQQMLASSGIDALALQDIAIDVAAEKGYDTDSTLTQAQQDELKAAVYARYEAEVGPLSMSQKARIEAAMPQLEKAATYGLIAEEASAKLNGIKSGIAQAENAISSVRPGGVAAARAARVKDKLNELNAGSKQVLMADKGNIRADRRDGLAELEKARLEATANLLKLVEKHNQSKNEQLNYIS